MDGWMVWLWQPRIRRLLTSPQSARLALGYGTQVYQIFNPRVLSRVMTNIHIHISHVLNCSEQHRRVPFPGCMHTKDLPTIDDSDTVLPYGRAQ